MKEFSVSFEERTPDGCVVFKHTERDIDLYERINVKDEAISWVGTVQRIIGHRHYVLPLWDLSLKKNKAFLG